MDCRGQTKILKGTARCQFQNLTSQSLPWGTENAANQSVLSLAGPVHPRLRYWGTFRLCPACLMGPIDCSFLIGEFRSRTKIALRIATLDWNLLVNQWPEVEAFWLAACTVPSRSHLMP